MKGLNKRLLGSILLIVFAFQLFATVAFAAVDAQSIVDEIGYVLEYIDIEKEESPINSAYNALVGLELDVDTNAAIDELVTGKVKEKFGSEQRARNAVLNILSESIAMYFTTDAASLKTAIVEAESKIASDFAIAFGSDIDIAKWFDLLLLTRKDAQFVANGSEKHAWALGAKIDVYQKMDELQNRTANTRLEKESYADIRTAIVDGLGWNIEMITAASRKLFNIADNSNFAEFALLKAAARSSVRVYAGLDDITPVLAGRDYIENADKYDPQNVPDDQDIKLYVLETDVTNLVGFYSSNPEVVTITPNQADETFTISYTGNRGTAEIILFRDPTGDNDPEAVNGGISDWLVRWSVSVLNNIETVSKPVWGTGTDEGKIFWTPVTNADHYTVKLYKDGKLIETVENVTDTYCDFNETFTGNGSYTVDVQAFGDVKGEVSEVSERSDAYDVSTFLPLPSAPVWAEDANSVTLNWNAVPGAESYVIRIYDSNLSSTPIATVDSVVGTSCGFTNFLKDKIGKYYATIEAVNTETTSGESVKSSAYTCKASITGVVKLQGGADGYKNDNTGIIVTVSNYPLIKAETNDKGEFTLKGLPVETIGKTFELKFDFVREVNGQEVRSHLAAVKTITANSASLVFSNHSAPFMLYYGDFNGRDGIGAPDLSYLIKRFGYNNTDNDPLDLYKNNPYVDCTEDGKIFSEELMLILENAGRTTTNAYN